MGASVFVGKDLFVFSCFFTEVFLSLASTDQASGVFLQQALQAGIEKYMEFYNFRRFHSALKYDKPMKVYQSGMKKIA